MWGVFFLLTTFVSLWFCGQATLRLKEYLRYGCITQGYVENFLVKELAADKYVIEAHFVYEVDSVYYQGATLLNAPVFLNRDAALQHVAKHWEEKAWGVWYDREKPSYASIQRLFPFKALFNAGLSLGILLYFIGLKNYMARKLCNSIKCKEGF